MSDLGESGKHLRLLVDFLDGAGGRLRIVGCDVLEDVFEPALRFIGPQLLLPCADTVRHLII